MNEQQEMTHQSFLVEEMRLVKKVHTDNVFQWLAAGWADVKALKGCSVAYAALFLCIGIFISFGFYALELPYLVLPSLSGFLLVGPAIAVGFYEGSRRMKEGVPCSLWNHICGFRRNTYVLMGIGIAQVFLFMIWIRFSFTLFAIAFPGVSPDWAHIIVRAISMEGIHFAIMITVLGFCFALLIFVTGAFSLPLVVDRKTMLIPAFLTSMYAVYLNRHVMMLWAFMIVLMMFAGLITGAGLLLTFPLIGHATWHAYKDVFRQAD